MALSDTREQSIRQVDSPVGSLEIEIDDYGVRRLQFEAFAEKESGTFSNRRQSVFDALRRELDQYFQGKLRRFAVPLSLKGTEFQLAVWAQLQKIPFGETRSYQAVATAIGRSKAVRAVGSANGLNPIAIIVPCHRVVAKGGGIGGYGGGLERKRFLLDLESRG